MALFTTQGYIAKLVAGSEQTILDLFKDEEIKVSNNILDLFDLGEIPGTFTQTLTLPGTKKNNAFFEHYYDISVWEPDLFNTNQIVQAYLDFDSFYLVNGYIQLQKVNVLENKFIDSYEVNIFGIVSNFSVDTRSSFLTDLTSLNIYNHTSSVANITSSWTKNLFNGDIVYPMAEYGQQIAYSPAVGSFGIDVETASLSVQDYKPAIRIKKVWDAIFNQFGYVYTGSFWNEPFLDDVYLVLNNRLRTVVYPESIENYGQGKLINISGSTPQNLTTTAVQGFYFQAIANDYDNKFFLDVTGIDATTYANDITTFLEGKGELGFEVSRSNALSGSGAPQFTIYFANTTTSTTVTVPLTDINNYMVSVAESRVLTATEKFKLPFKFRTPEIDSGSISIRIGYIHTGVDNFVVNLAPDEKNLSTFEITKVNQIADGQVVEIAQNMPAGNSGIRVIDFIRAVQKKFNLVIYADKTAPNRFIVETFNQWYKSGRIVDFNQFINVAEKLSVTPANSLAFRQIKFQDAQDTDYVTTLFVRQNNRSYGESNFYDSASFFSQGQLNVNSEAIASAPLSAIPGTANTGSLLANCTSYQLNNSLASTDLEVTYNDCNTNSLTNYTVPATRIRTICARSNTLQVTTPSDNYSINNLGNCSGTPSNTGSIQLPGWIPSFISSDKYAPAKVLPRIFFYNGLLPATPYYISGYDLPTTSSISTYQLFKYPYFDCYSTGSGSIFPGSDSKSLLYNNELAVIGSTPTSSLVSEYWDKYLALLYNPRTRLVECSAVIPLGDYVGLELNDIVEFRGSYYHLRAINDYNLKTGECNLQLLGPIIGDTISEIASWAPYEDPCEFSFSASIASACNSFTATKLNTFQVTSNISWTDCYSVTQSVDLYNPAGVGEIETITFCALSSSLSYNDTEISVIDNGPCAGKQWNNEPNLWNFNKNKWENA